MLLMASFGEWLRKYRKEKGLTQDELASASGVSPSYISTIERDQPHTITGGKIRPEREKVLALAKAVGGDPVVALLLCGYSATLPPNDTPESFDIAENVRVSMLHGKTLSKTERERFEAAFKTAYEMAKQMNNAADTNEQQ